MLLGDRVHARFGLEFPIRFDFLDTVDGQNLSLQVHPLTEYIQQTFGMHYTQDESYYILDVKPGADTAVYLGVKERRRPAGDARRARARGKETGEFDAERYVNRIPAHKHDHFLIPAGTVHCSGRDTMVLEISATPYIFTFKLWTGTAWGLDGKPRPIHLEHGRKNIQFDRDTDFVLRELVGQAQEVARGDGWVEELTGLHEREFLETRRHWFTKPVLHNTNGGGEHAQPRRGQRGRRREPDRRVRTLPRALRRDVHRAGGGGGIRHPPGRSRRSDAPP